LTDEFNPPLSIFPFVSALVRESEKLEKYDNFHIKILLHSSDNLPFHPPTKFILN
jgi:hypothetical protein